MTNNYNLAIPDDSDEMPEDPFELVNFIFRQVDAEFREMEEFAVASAYLQGKKDGIRLAQAILVPTMARYLELEIATAADKWDGTDVGKLMEGDVDIVREISSRENREK